MQSVVRVPWRAYMSTLPNEIVAAVFSAPTLELGTVLTVEAAAYEQAQYVDPATIYGRAAASESDEEDENEEDGERPATLRSISQLDSSAPTGLDLFSLMFSFLNMQFALCLC